VNGHGCSVTKGGRPRRWRCSLRTSPRAGGRPPDLAGAQRAKERLLSARAGRSYGYWTAITGWWIDANTANHDVDWLHGEQDARTRWLAPLTARRKI
jgi:hypothetical protein